MKPIGPYVAARDLPAGPDRGPIRTLRATDRLTGMPVLLHVLPFAPRVPQLPDHVGLLPIVDSGMDGETAYVVSELPMQATPASDPLLAARDVLAALNVLHGLGVMHGGISAAQLWEVDGRVALAGAGLPWHDAPSSGGDLRALARALDGIGILPAVLVPLRDAPDTMTAAEALALLDAPTSPSASPAPAVASAPVGQPGVVAEPVPPSPSVTAPHDGTPIVLGEDTPEAGAARADGEAHHAPATPSPSPATRPAAKSRKSKSVLHRAAGNRDVAAPVSPAPSVTVDAPDVPTVPDAVRLNPALPNPAIADEAVPDDGVADAAVQTIPVPEAAGVPVTAAPALSREVSAAGAAPRSSVAGSSAELPAGSPVPAFSSAPAGTVETPQERRRRQNEERLAQAKLDAQAAAARKVERLRAEAQARPPEPVRIGFTSPSPTVIGDDDLPDWTPPGTPGDAVESDAVDGAVPVIRPTLKMRTVERLPESLRRPPEPEPEPEPTPVASGRLPARHMGGAPIRIGWDEDDSWRVVKAVEGPPVRERGRAPRWLVPVAVVTLAALLVAGVTAQLRRPAVTAACCDVTFTLRGAAGATAQLTVLGAPATAGLTGGQVLGRAPGLLHLPVAGTYRLKVVADGYGPGELSVTVPRTLPVSINLGP